MHTHRCPRCRVQLLRVFDESVQRWACTGCGWVGDAPEAQAGPPPESTSSPLPEGWRVIEADADEPRHPVG
jgi:rubredoxin